MSNKCISLSVSSFKGGISKTTSLLNLGAYLWRHLDKHILFIDTDPQGNLTSMFDIPDAKRKEHGLVNAYKHDGSNPRASWSLKPYKINNNVDIITATGELSNVDDIMRHKQTLAPYVLFHYLSSIKAFSKYDYILMDTHNNFNLNTQDTLICSDFTMIPVTASRFSMDGIKETLDSIADLKNNLIDPVTSKSLIKTNIFMIGAIVPFVTKASHEFLSLIKQDKHFVTYFHQRELFNRANFNHNDVFKEAKNKKSDQKVINTEINPAMKKIVNYINSKEAN